MRLLNRSFYLITLLLHLLPVTRLQAQASNKDSLLHIAAYDQALQIYHTALTPETGLYRGPQYVDYAYTLSKGQPFLGEGHIEKGAIRYNDIYYEDMPFLFDLVKQQLVTYDHDRVFKIALINALIDSFTIGNHIFIHLRDSLNPTAPRNGFYEQLSKGRVTLLKKEKKTIQDDLSSPTEGVKKYIDYSVAYYLRMGNRYYSVNNKNSLLSAMTDKKKEAKKFMRKNGLSMRKDKEGTLLQVVAWYNGVNQ